MFGMPPRPIQPCPERLIRREEAAGACSAAGLKRFACLAGGVIFAFSAAAVSAQTVWDNGGLNNRWGTATNWNPNAVPNALTTAVQFNATDDNATVSNIQLRGNYSVQSITFNAVDDAFSLINGTGSRTLTLGTGGITRTAGSSNAQSLAMTTLALTANTAMNIAGSGSLTISSAITGASRSVTKDGAGELILSGANTFSGGVTMNAGTLTVSSASALGTGSLTLAGGTLRLNTASVSLGTLSVTGNSTIDFAGNNTLNLTNFSINAGVTLTILNWTNGSDFLYATNWTGATQDTTGAAPMNQVSFSGFSASDTQWQSLDDQITPVPEPSAYGALLLGGISAVFWWWRRRRTAA
jgi:autotransporter-associated beta strand protein